MAILAALFLSNQFPKLSIGIILSGMMVLGVVHVRLVNRLTNKPVP